MRLCLGRSPLQSNKLMHFEAAEQGTPVSVQVVNQLLADKAHVDVSHVGADFLQQP